MDNSVAGRIGLVGNIFLLSLAVSGVALIGRLDARDWQLDYDLLSLVAHTNARMDAATFKTSAADGRILLMERADESDVRERYTRARERVLEWMRDAGYISADDMPGMRILGDADRIDAPSISMTRFIFDAYQESLMRAHLREDDVVSFYLDRHRVLLDLFDVEIVTEITGDLPAMHVDGRSPLTMVFLDEKGLVFLFGRLDDATGRSVERVEVERHVTENINPQFIAPYLMSGDGYIGEFKVLDAHGLDYFSPALEERLRRSYGTMPMSMAREIASGGLLDGYGRVSIFGFEFSTKRFPLAASVVMFGAAIVLLVSVRRMRAEDALESLGSSLPSSTSARLFLWVVAPACTVGLSLPFALVGTLEIAIAGTLGGLAAVLGALAMARSRASV